MILYIRAIFFFFVSFVLIHSAVAAPVITITGASIVFSPTNAQKVAIGNSVVRYYIVKGTGLTNDITATVSPSTDFLISLSVSGPWSTSVILTPTAGSVPNTNVYIRFAPTGAAGNKSTTITNSSPGATSKLVNVTGFALATTPSVQGTIASATLNPGSPSTTCDFTFTPGDGTARVLVIRESPVYPTNKPVNGVTYLNVNDFTSVVSTVNELSVTNKTRIVYVGSGLSVTVTGFSSSTYYSCYVMEYNDGGVAGAENYLTTFSGGAIFATSSAIANYTWTGSISNDFTVAGNWSPNRTSPSTEDVLEFTSSPSGNITNVPTQTIRQLNISGTNTSVALQAGSNNNILTLSGSSSIIYSLNVASGCTLTLSGSNILVLTIATGKYSSINGDLILQDANHSLTGGTWSWGSNATVYYSGSAPISISNVGYNNLVINASATITAPAANLKVKKDFTASSNFNANGGTIELFASTTQTLNGQFTLNNLSITGSGGKIVTAGGANRLNITGTLDISNINARLYTNSNLYFPSTASVTGRIGVLPANNLIVGSIVMQRYLPGGTRLTNLHLSSPVNGATVGQWQPTQFDGLGQPTNGFYITGSFSGASNPGYGLNPASSSFSIWNASTGAYSSYPTGSSSDPLVPGTGYRTIMRDGGAGYFGNTYVAKTISTSGTPNMGDQSYALSYSATGGGPVLPDGWNLIGNPYPSNITADLTATGWDLSSANLQGLDVYIWDSDAGAYVTCNSGSGNCIIPSSQGFWVRTSTNGTLQSTESVKVSGSTPIYKKAAENIISFKFKNSTYRGWDIGYVKFAVDASEVFDSQHDAYEPLALYETPEDYVLGVYSVASNGAALSINTLPELNDETIVHLYTKSPEGFNTLSFDISSFLYSDCEVYLKDKHLGIIIDLRKSQDYSYQANTVSGLDNQRFDLVFTRVASFESLAEGNELVAFPNPYTGENNITLVSNQLGEEVEIIISDVMGKIVFQDHQLNSGGYFEYKFVPGKDLKPGVYSVTCKSSGKTVNTKLIIH